MKLVCAFILSVVFNLSFASVIPTYSYGPADCISCSGASGWQQNHYNMGIPGHMAYPATGQYFPWWYNYSSQYYPNYYQPAPWANYGIQGDYYPSHHGGGMVGKPNVYIYGKVGQKFSLTFEFDKKSLFLASAPEYKHKWEGLITRKGIKSGDAYYNYFYYDYSVDIKKLQWRQGKCVEREKLIDYMANILKKNQFQKNEIKDFKDYWTYKTPYAETYCVYPQGNKELAKVVQLETTPAAKVNRLIFFVVPQNKIDKKSKLAYFRKPDSIWSGNKKEKKEYSIQINEWGVGFLDEDFVKTQLKSIR